MKRHAITLFGLLLGFLFLAGTAQAQNPGIRVKENKTKTIVYEIKVVGADDAALCQYLDQKMKTTVGVLSSSTSTATGICTVEVNATVTQEMLKQVVKNCGMDVAKSF